MGIFFIRRTNLIYDVSEGQIRHLPEGHQHQEIYIRLVLLCGIIVEPDSVQVSRRHYRQLDSIAHGLVETFQKANYSSRACELPRSVKNCNQLFFEGLTFTMKKKSQPKLTCCLLSDKMLEPIKNVLQFFFTDRVLN